jgi:hypothetical protein
MLIPTTTTITDVPIQWLGILSTLITVNYDLRKVSETKDLDYNGYTVQKVQADKIAQFLFPNKLDRDKNIDLFGCSDHGLVTGESHADGTFYFERRSGEKIPVGIFDVKSSAYAATEGLRQAISEATNVALWQFDQGVPPQDIMVPVVGGNGHLFQFGAIVLLFPFFPVYVPLSKTLDMAVHTEMELIACFLWKILKFIDEMEHLWNQKEHGDVKDKRDKYLEIYTGEKTRII